MRISGCWTLVAAVLVVGAGSQAADLGVENIDQKATHEQVAVIDVKQGSQDSLTVNAFCLSAEGNILAACGNGPGEIRVLDADGKFLRAWPISVKPEAVGVAKDGTVLVGGFGKLFRYSMDGKELAQVESPHAAAIKKNAGKLREEAISRMQRSTNNLASTISTYEQIITQLEAKKKSGELNDQEQRILQALPATLKRFKEQQLQQAATPTPKLDEEAVKRQVENMTRSKMRIASISADNDYVYIAVPALTGYGFEVWQLDPQLKRGQVIVSGLRGCCGQMDVQVNSAGLYVAENSRHRVVRYDPKGELVTAWGQRDRTGIDGFTSCCNPMNVCFNAAGDVFTAESNTGRIKRYSADGKFQNYVGDVKLVPGCKNVSIAVSADSQRVYMLDITRNHIVLMKKKAT